MPRVLLRAIRGRREHPNWAGIATEMLRVVESKTKADLIAKHEKRVDNWEHKPQFKARKTLNREGLKISVYPAGKNKNYWLWVIQGTKPHRIEPKRASVLAFPSLYTPKTTPAGGYGGPGTSSGDTIFAMGVDHPGTESREQILRDIAKECRPTFRRDMENACRRGARKSRG